MTMAEIVVAGLHAMAESVDMQTGDNPATRIQMVDASILLKPFAVSVIHLK